MATLSPEIVAKVRTVTASSYTEQAIFYLNAFWAQGASEEAETVWELVHAFAKEDHVKGKEGNELNPIQAFNVLQKRNQTLTALELKAQLRKVDIDANGEMALCEYLLFINNRDPVAFVTNPQGQVDPVKLKALEDKMVELDNELQILNVKQAEAEKAEKEAKEAQAAADDSAAKVCFFQSDYLFAFFHHFIYFFNSSPFKILLIYPIYSHPPYRQKLQKIKFALLKKKHVLLLLKSRLKKMLRLLLLQN